MITVIGQYDSEGRLLKYTRPVDVNQFANLLIDTDGTIWAVRDDYNDWVSPSLREVGIKSKIAVVDTEDNA